MTRKQVIADQAKVAAEQAAAEQVRLAADEKQRKEDTWCVRKEVLLHSEALEAYRNRIYLTLNPVEQCVMFELARGYATWDAYNRVGIPRELGTNIFKKLLGLHLVTWCSHGYEFPAGATAIIKNLRLGGPEKPKASAAPKDANIFTLSDADEAFLNTCGISSEVSQS